MGIYCAPYVIVQEQDREWLYGKIMDDTNGLPNYYPPATKYPRTIDFLIDEVLFLPVESEYLQPGGKDYFGYRYLFNTVQHQTISLGPDPLQVGISVIEMRIEVQRVVFGMLEEHKIQIREARESIYPPRVVKVEHQTREVGIFIQRLTHQFIAEYNAWYLTRRI